MLLEKNPKAILCSDHFFSYGTKTYFKYMGFFSLLRTVKHNCPAIKYDKCYPECMLLDVS